MLSIMKHNDMLSSNAFQVLDPRRIPLQRIAADVSVAEAIVAPHGGQCYNIVFARRGAVSFPPYLSLLCACSIEVI